MPHKSNYLKSTILFTIAFWVFSNIIAFKIFASESIIDSVWLVQDTTFQKDDLDTLDINENGFEEIVKEKFIEGPDLGMYFRLGILIVILYLGYRIVRKVCSNKT